MSAAITQKQRQSRQRFKKVLSLSGLALNITEADDGKEEGSRIMAELDRVEDWLQNWLAETDEDGDYSGVEPLEESHSTNERGSIFGENISEEQEHQILTHNASISLMICAANLIPYRLLMRNDIVGDAEESREEFFKQLMDYSKNTENGFYKVPKFA